MSINRTKITRIWYLRSYIETSNRQNCKHSYSVLISMELQMQKLKLRWATLNSTQIVTKFFVQSFVIKRQPFRCSQSIYYKFVLFAPSYPTRICITTNILWQSGSLNPNMIYSIEISRNRFLSHQGFLLSIFF